MKLTGAQMALVAAMQRGATLRLDRMDGRHKAQSRVVRVDTGEDVTSVANGLKDRGVLRADWTLAKAGHKVPR